MNNDYQYQPKPLPPKNEGLFGYGGRPNEGSRGFQGDIVDYGGGVQVQQGPPGPQGPPGDINLPSGSGVLGINNGVLFVYETIDCEDTGGTGP